MGLIARSFHATVDHLTLFVTNAFVNPDTLDDDDEWAPGYRVQFPKLRPPNSLSPTVSPHAGTVATSHSGPITRSNLYSYALAAERGDSLADIIGYAKFVLHGDLEHRYNYLHGKGYAYRERLFAVARLGNEMKMFLLSDKGPEAKQKNALSAVEVAILFRISYSR
jgi:hypothetical protein